MPPKNLLAEADDTVPSGSLDAEGFIEYAPDGEKVIIRKMNLDGIDGDYIHETPSAPTEHIAKKVGQTVRQYSNEPTLEAKVDELAVRNSRLGFVNRAAKPPYRVFFTDVAIEINEF